MRAESNEEDGDQKPSRPVVPMKNKPDWNEYHGQQHGENDIKIETVPVSTNGIEQEIWCLVRHEEH